MKTTTPTTLKIWSEDDSNDMCHGLEIAGIMISYSELAEIDSRESALDRGVTPELLSIWDYQGGRDYAQLVDWLYQYATEQQG
jgi:hypothetical protein